MRLAAGLSPDPLGELKRSPDRPTRNRGVLLLRGRAFQLTGLMMAQGSLKYKAQRERRVPNSSHILLMEKKHKKFFPI